MERSQWKKKISLLIVSLPKNSCYLVLSGKLPSEDMCDTVILLFYLCFIYLSQSRKVSYLSVEIPHLMICFYTDSNGNVSSVAQVCFMH